MRYSGIQLDIGRYARIQLDTVRYSGIHSRFAAKWLDTGIQRDAKDAVRYRQDTGEIQAGDPKTYTPGEGLFTVVLTAKQTTIRRIIYINNTCLTLCLTLCSAVTVTDSHKFDRNRTMIPNTFTAAPITINTSNKGVTAPRGPRCALASTRYYFTCFCVCKNQSTLYCRRPFALPTLL